ncbi:MAG: hypothetical protein ACU0CI_06335 [Shimia sp.]
MIRIRPVYFFNVLSGGLTALGFSTLSVPLADQFGLPAPVWTGSGLALAASMVLQYLLNQAWTDARMTGSALSFILAAVFSFGSLLGSASGVAWFANSPAIQAQVQRDAGAPTADALRALVADRRAAADAAYALSLHLTDLSDDEERYGNTCGGKPRKGDGPNTRMRGDHARAAAGIATSQDELAGRFSALEARLATATTADDQRQVYLDARTLSQAPRIFRDARDLRAMAGRYGVVLTDDGGTKHRCDDPDTATELVALADAIAAPPALPSAAPTEIDATMADAIACVALRLHSLVQEVSTCDAAVVSDGAILGASAMELVTILLLVLDAGRRHALGLRTIRHDALRLALGDPSPEQRAHAVWFLSAAARCVQVIGKWGTFVVVHRDPDHPDRETALRLARSIGSRIPVRPDVDAAVIDPRMSGRVDLHLWTDDAEAELDRAIAWTDGTTENGIGVDPLSRTS